MLSHWPPHKEELNRERFVNIAKTTDLAHTDTRKTNIANLARTIRTNLACIHFISYELDNGQIFSEAGALKTLADGSQVVFVTGQYSYVGPDGQIYWVNYTADENGFHPEVGTGPAGGIQGGGDAAIDPNALKSLIGK